MEIENLLERRVDDIAAAGPAVDEAGMDLEFATAEDEAAEAVGGLDDDPLDGGAVDLDEGLAGGAPAGEDEEVRTPAEVHGWTTTARSVTAEAPSAWAWTRQVPGGRSKVACCQPGSGARERGASMGLPPPRGVRVT